ncbi:MAG: lysine--tRNA ligase [Gammaproteobacteria bacterium]
MTDNTDDQNKLILERRKKLESLREGGFNYPRGLEIDAYSQDLQEQFASLTGEDLQSRNKEVMVAGRMMAKRVMGKSSFSKIKDGTGEIQIFLSSSKLSPETYDQFKTLDVGDIIWVKGPLFKTKTDELTINVMELELLTKSLRPLPEKYHGLTDTEIRYRQRYLDLIMSQDSQDVFKIRSKIISKMRNYLSDRKILEVETPMMHPIPGGAVARPFITHHNALDRDFYLRIAPELYLKRLVIGGFDRIFEINRCFRNEGVSTQHNPEFTMLELYMAYCSAEDIMDLLEDMIFQIALEIKGSDTVRYQGNDYDVSKPFQRVTLEDSVLAHNPNLDVDLLRDKDYLTKVCADLGIEVKQGQGSGKLLLEIFEKTVEGNLAQPTFITDYPKEVSPLSRGNDEDPWLVDRFEFFVAGRELANGFQELNDPDEQAERFNLQVQQRESGDEEAMVYDEDYIQALEYGLPPTAGLGVGIDRLVMFLTDSPSIRDVLFFPQMREK